MKRYYIISLLLCMGTAVEGFSQCEKEKYYYSYDTKQYICEVPNRFIITCSTEYVSALKELLLQDKGTLFEWVRDNICIVQVNASQNQLFRENIRLPGIKSLHPMYRSYTTSDPNKLAEMGITDEFVIKPKEDAPIAEIEKLHQKYQVTVKSTTSYLSQVLSVPAKADALEIANLYQESGLVVYSQPGFMGKLSPDPPPPPPFFDTTTSWTEITTNPMDETYCRIDSYKLMSDTIFNHTLYKTVYLNNNVYIGALRKDNAKIFAYFYPIEEERLIYDFEWSVGKSVCFEYYEQAEQSYYCREITEINPGLWWAGLYYDTTFNDSDNQLIRWIGFKHGFFSHIFPAPANGDQTRLLCFSRNGKLLYQNENYKNCTSCDLASSVNKINGEKQLHLIHTQGGIIFDITNMNNETLSLCLYNMAGQQLYSRQTVSQQTAINNLERGCYFYKVTGSKNVYVGKFIID